MYGKVGFHIDNTVVLYGIAGASSQSLNDILNIDGGTYGFGIRLNSRSNYNLDKNMAIEFNILKSELSDNLSNKYTTHQANINYLLHF